MQSARELTLELEVAIKKAIDDLPMEEKKYSYIMGVLSAIEANVNLLKYVFVEGR